jgi:hypothetical protein
VARLEALTALWERQVRLEGPPDATMLYAAPRLPPVPPSRPAPGPAPAPVDREPVPGQRVSDWASRHDPRSLEFAVRRKLAGRVPIADVLLEHGPILDQGTAPPLTLEEASACVGMAAVAAANVLEVRDGTDGRATDRLRGGGRPGAVRPTLARWTAWTTRSRARPSWPA